VDFGKSWKARRIVAGIFHFCGLGKRQVRKLDVLTHDVETCKTETIWSTDHTASLNNELI
jgi:predicted subunit of tRNA(5-methylaminomethyl-2-thiouridylate) methyltransferase